MNPITYFREVFEELRKVVWPKRSAVVKLTATVIILSGILGMYLAGLDFLFAGILTKLITK